MTPDALVAALQHSLREGYLFGNHDEPLDAAGRRIVRVIQQRLEESREEESQDAETPIDVSREERASLVRNVSQVDSSQRVVSLVAALQQLQQQWEDEAATATQGYLYAECYISCARQLSALLGRISEEAPKVESDQDGHIWASSKFEPGFYQCANCGRFGRDVQHDHKPPCERLEREDDSIITAFCGSYVYNPQARCTCGAPKCSGKAALPLGADAPTDELGEPTRTHLGWLLAKVMQDPKYPEARVLWERYSDWVDAKKQPSSLQLDHSEVELTTDDPRVVSVMGSVPECAANGCQFRKTSGYRPGEHADFPSAATLQAPVGVVALLERWGARYEARRQEARRFPDTACKNDELDTCIGELEQLLEAPLPAPAPETPK
jgi:hypothetical protein